MPRLPQSHTKLHGREATILAQAHVCREHIEYFEKKLVLPHGWREGAICFFFEKLHEAVAATGLAPAWDPENESAVAIILERLNFNLPSDGKPKSKSKAK